MTDDGLMNMWQREFYGIVLEQEVNGDTYYHFYVTIAAGYSEAKQKAEEEVKVWRKYPNNGNVIVLRVEHINKRDLDNDAMIQVAGV